MLMLPCLCGGIEKTEALKALVLYPKGSAATLRAKTLGAFLRLDRTGRVRNEPMFGVAAKETECALQASARTYYRYLRNRANR